MKIAFPALRSAFVIITAKAVIMAVSTIGSTATD